MVMKTFLPLFPGFYGTNYEFNTEGIEDYLIDENMSSAFENFLRYVLQTDYEKIAEDDYKGYTLKVAKSACQYVEDMLFLMFDTPVKVVFEEIHSPKYYNFSNDAIYIDIVPENEDKFIAEINAYLKKHWSAFEKYIKKNYTSCDGFISSYSNNAYDWYGDYYNQHELGSILQFCLIENGNDEEDMLQYMIDTDSICVYEFVKLKDSIYNAIQDGTLKSFMNELERLENQKELYIENMKRNGKFKSFMLTALENQEKKNYDSIFDEICQVLELD